MSYIKALYLKSKELYDHLQEALPSNEDERDVYIDKITFLLDEREVLMQEAVTRNNFSDVEKKIGEEIVKMNKSINERLELIKSQIGNDIRDLKVKKEQGQKYENPYDARTPDGVFFDRDI